MPASTVAASHEPSPLIEVGPTSTARKLAQLGSTLSNSVFSATTPVLAPSPNTAITAPASGAGWGEVLLFPTIVACCRVTVLLREYTAEPVAAPSGSSPMLWVYATVELTTTIAPSRDAIPPPAADVPDAVLATTAESMTVNVAPASAMSAPPAPSVGPVAALFPSIEPRTTRADPVTWTAPPEGAVPLRITRESRVTVRPVCPTTVNGRY